MEQESMSGPACRRRKKTARSTSRATVVLLWLVGVLAGPSLVQANDAPALLNFSTINLGDGFWLLWGSVLDESPESCRIDFGGDLQGLSCVADSNGDYQMVVDIPYGTGGWVPATAVDSEGLPSDPTYDFVANY
jgi:hypothetical protein